MAERTTEANGVVPSSAFIDLEASGLSAASWPIEVGWAFETGPARSLLIRPDPSWAPHAWSPEAERLHRIGRADLDRDGVAAVEAAEALNAALSGTTVWSDAPDWDGFWLYRLFSAAKVRQRFSLSDFGRLMRAHAAAEEAAIRRAALVSPRRHRAGPDAKHLQTLYAFARRAID